MPIPSDILREAEQIVRIYKHDHGNEIIDTSHVGIHNPMGLFHGLKVRDALDNEYFESEVIGDIALCIMHQRRSPELYNNYNDRTALMRSRITTVAWHLEISHEKKQQQKNAPIEVPSTWW